jgi:NAD(P)-dependent dehydrogenase (short-subunit alcohol dehydrogenase family)
VARVASRYALKRMATADEIAAAILFLTGNESSYMTGATIAVDGGRTFY